MQRRSVKRIEPDERVGGSPAETCSDIGADQPLVGFEAFPQDRAEQFLRSAVGGSQVPPTFRIIGAITDMPPVIYPDPPKV